MIDAHFKVLAKLYQIPQRKHDSMILHGEDLLLAADELEKLGLVVSGVCDFGKHWRMTKEGRNALLVEWVKRGRPTHKQVFGDEAK